MENVVRRLDSFIKWTRRLKRVMIPITLLMICAVPMLASNWGMYGVWWVVYQHDRYVCFNYHDPYAVAYGWGACGEMNTAANMMAKALAE
jgi:hypothetical protein